jgi:acyl-CoA synthetase (AMP-forming)/AMP-acid ligase II
MESRKHASVQAEILARLAEAPEAKCLASYGWRDGIRWLSRAEVNARATCVAATLLRCGVTPGDVCVIMLPSGHATALAVTATLFVGAVPLLIAPPTLFGANLNLYETLESTVRRTRARLAICWSSLESDLTDVARKFPATRFLFVAANWPTDGEKIQLEPVLPQATDIAAMQLTSGTTATPRICVWDHKGILAALNGMAAAMRVSSEDVCLNWTPLYHDMGLVNNFLLCLARGIPLVLVSPQEFIRKPALWLRGLSETGATITWSPNFGYAVTSRKAADDELERVRLDHVRAFWNAAECIHLETMKAFHRRFAALGVRWEALKTNYGCAENVGGATFSALDAPPRSEVIDRLVLEERGIAQSVPAAENDARCLSVVSTGRASPGLAVRILSRRGRELPDGHVGEICLETASRMIGYHDRSQETGHALRGGLLHTGDLGYLRDGELFWVGRLRERITIQGRKLDPSVFERVLASIPGLREGCFVVFGVSDPGTGTQRIIVVSEIRVQLAEHPREISAGIRRACFVHLGVTPEDVVLVRPGTLAKTSSGKRRHRHFRKLYLGGELERDRVTDAAAPLGELNREPPKLATQGC